MSESDTDHRRRMRARNEQNRAVRAKAKTLRTPLSLQDCLAPLAAGALETSLLAHKWGTTKGSLMRASTVMEFCSQVIAESNRLIGHDTSVAATPVPQP